MSVQYGGDKITFSDGSTVGSGWSGMKNRIINGAMTIDQRNAGASVTPTGTGYTLDRWRVLASQSSKFSVQQNAGSVTPPAGFKNYLGITSLSAYTVATGEIFGLQHKIEGYNVADLMYGTANAQTVTLSFWVRSSLTGTFGGVFGNVNADRCYIFSYTINAANTWEQKTITVAGDTTGTWNTTTDAGLDIRFNFGSGSDKLSTAGSWGSTFYNSVTGQTSVVGTNGATFYITGVQLEKGSTATSFDYRPYGTELALCQRYFWCSYPIGTAVGSITNLSGSIQWTPSATCSYAMTSVCWTTMRSLPTVTTYSPYTGTSGKIRNVDTSTDVTGNAAPSYSYAQVYIGNSSTTNVTTISAHITASAEL